MGPLKKFLISFFSCSLLFILLLNVSALMGSSPNKSESFLNKIIIVKAKRNIPVNTVIHRTPSLKQIDKQSLRSVYLDIKKLNLISNDFCAKKYRSTCKTLFAYSLAKADWTLATKLTNSICQDSKSCPLSALAQKLKNKKWAQPNLNQFSKDLGKWSQQIETFVSNTNFDEMGLVCSYAENELDTQCVWNKRKLELQLSVNQIQKLTFTCLDSNSLIDCWTLSLSSSATTRGKAHRSKARPSDHKDRLQMALSKACTLDSAAACYQVALHYQAQKLNQLAKKYLQKSCTLKFSNACLLLGSKYYKANSISLYEFYQSKNCAIKDSCKGQRSPASFD